ncbi:hypothetical protein X975_00615, partial [Stegodyphus mimosarum]
MEAIKRQYLLKETQVREEIIEITLGFPLQKQSQVIEILIVIDHIIDTIQIQEQIPNVKMQRKGKIMNFTIKALHSQLTQIMIFVLFEVSKETRNVVKENLKIRKIMALVKIQDIILENRLRKKTLLSQLSCI